jgi:hypothetical protein
MFRYNKPLVKWFSAEVIGSIEARLSMSIYVHTVKHYRNMPTVSKLSANENEQNKAIKRSRDDANSHNRIKKGG